MYRFHSNLINDTITVLEEGDTRFLAVDSIILEQTEQEVICNTELTLNSVHNTYLLKKMFDGQIVNYTICPICGSQVQKEQTEDGNIWLFEPNTEEVHRCK